MITVQMAPELLADLGPQAWLRDATPAESDEFNKAHPLVGGTDRMNRPYFTVVIDETQCPPAWAKKAQQCSRIRWAPEP